MAFFPSPTESRGQTAIEGLLVGALVIVLVSVVLGEYNAYQLPTTALTMAKTGTLSHLSQLEQTHYLKTIEFIQTPEDFRIRINIDPDLQGDEKQQLQAFTLDLETAIRNQTRLPNATIEYH